MNADSRPTSEPPVSSSPNAAESTWRSSEIDAHALRELRDLIGDELADHMARLAELEKFVHDPRVWARLGPRGVGQIEDAIEDIRDAVEGHYEAR